MHYYNYFKCLTLAFVISGTSNLASINFMSYIPQAWQSTLPVIEKSQTWFQVIVRQQPPAMVVKPPYSHMLLQWLHDNPKKSTLLGVTALATFCTTAYYLYQRAQYAHLEKYDDILHTAKTGDHVFVINDTVIPLGRTGKISASIYNQFGHNQQCIFHNAESGCVCQQKLFFVIDEDGATLYNATKTIEQKKPVVLWTMTLTDINKLFNLSPTDFKFESWSFYDDKGTLSFEGKQVCRNSLLIEKDGSVYSASMLQTE